MIRLESSEALQRKIRQDDVVELATGTWDLVRKAIQGGRTDEVLDFMEYGLCEATWHHDSLVSFVDMVVTHLSRFGEEEVEKIYRQRYYPLAKDWLAVTPGVEESLQRGAELFRDPYSNITITEESDRYVMSLDPCRTGGRLRRTRSVKTTKKAYPWSWSKSGVPYYCAHCCLMLEVIPIELRGYPIAVVQHPEKPENPCVHLYYKKSELIPEKYFTRVGKAKTIK